MRCFPRQMKIGHTYSYKDTFDLNPPYQRRGGIWTKAQRQLLVDSVLGGFDIPKLYLHENPWHSPDKEYAVADGKQRLLTLWSFMNNEFSISENFTLVDSTNLPNGLPRPGSFYKDLAPAWQDHFAGTSLDFVVITTPKDGKEAERAIREVFTRLNSGASLSAGEKARARAGSLQDLARSISTHKFLTKCVSISTKRGEDMLLAQNLVAMEVEKFRNGSMICERSPERIRTLMLAEDIASGELADSIEETLINRLADLCEFFQESTGTLRLLTGPRTARVVVALIRQTCAPLSLILSAEGRLTRQISTVRLASTQALLCRAPTALGTLETEWRSFQDGWRSTSAVRSQNSPKPLSPPHHSHVQYSAFFCVLA